MNEYPVADRLALVAMELEALFPLIMPHFSDEESAGDMVSGVLECIHAAALVAASTARPTPKVVNVEQKRKDRNKAKRARKARRNNR